MNIRPTHGLIVRCAILAIALTPAAAFAQAGFPNKPITLSVGFAAGGGTDITARILAKKLAGQLGQPVNVDNKPGAGGNWAAALAARANSDGYFIHLTNIGSLTVSHTPRKNWVTTRVRISRRSRWRCSSPMCWWSIRRSRSAIWRITSKRPPARAEPKAAEPWHMAPPASAAPGIWPVPCSNR